MVTKITITLLVLFMFFSFLSYSGCFLRKNDPVEVAKYYFNSLKNREGFLNYRFSRSEHFDTDKYNMLYRKYKFYIITKGEFRLTDRSEEKATIDAFFYNRQSKFLLCKFGLTMDSDGWFVSNIDFFLL